MSNSLTDFNTENLICLCNVRPDVSEHDLRLHFEQFGSVHSVRIYYDIACAYIVFQNKEGHEKAIKSGRQRLKGRRYNLKTYKQLADEAQRFKRGDLLSLSGRWRSKFQGLFAQPTSQIPANKTDASTNSKFYVDVNDNKSKQNPFEESDNEEDPQPSTSGQATRKMDTKEEREKQGTLPFIDVDHPQMSQNSTVFTTPTVKNFPANKPLTASANSPEKADKVPKNFKQKTKTDEKLMAKDLLIDELRVHLNFVSERNETLTAERDQTSRDLDKQVAENFMLIEENQQLKEENDNLLAALRERLEQLRDTPQVEPESPFQDCCICMSNKSNCVLAKCGHVCLCDQCVSSAWRTGDKACPVCRQKVDGVVRLFL